MTGSEAADLISPDEIRALRGRLGIEQTEFAEVMSVSQTTISMWETGARRPSLKRQLVLLGLRGELDEVDESEIEKKPFAHKVIEGLAVGTVVMLLKKYFSDS